MVEVQVLPQERREWTAYRAYVPEKIDYAFELGSMWEDKNLYWVAGQIGFHAGRCMFSQSQTCQQYVDALAGAGGRDGQTNGMFLGALRWQFISFPEPFSPSIRLFAGVVRIRDDVRDADHFAYGIGYGWTASVHERVDLSLEARIGGADQMWSQVFIGVHLKADRWLAYFAEKMKEFGGDAAKMTGSAIRGTLRTGGEVMNTVVGKPIQKATEAISGDKKPPPEKDPKKD